MNPAAARRRRRGQACAWLLAAGVGAARAQLPGGVAVASPPPPPALSAPAPYVDRVLETGPQPQAEEGAAPRNDEGWARSLRLDYVLSTSRGSTASTSRGVAAAGYVETPQYGTLSLQASLVDNTADAATPLSIGRPASRTSTWRLDQRAMPLAGGWLADHAIGDIATGLPTLARGLSRIYLPSTPLRGLGGHWQLRDDVDLNASLGEPGLFSGYDVSGFESGGGRVLTAGGQFHLAGQRQAGSRMDAAVQTLQARDTSQPGIVPGKQVASTFGAFSWEGSAPWGEGVRAGTASEPLGLRPGGLALQLSALQSDGAGAPALGTWVDAAWRGSWLQNTAGLYRLEPNLRWGTSLMPADLVGGYWRAQLPMRQWQLGWDIEYSKSVSAAVAASGFASGSGRYQFTLRDALDATFSARTQNGSGQSAQLAWDHTGEWGQTRWRSNLLRTAQSRATFFGVDQAWALSAPNVLQTSLGWQELHSDGRSWPVGTWGIVASAAPWWGWSLDASLQGAQGDGAHSLLATVSLQWQFTRDWLLAARYTESRGRDPQVLQVVSALTAAQQALVTPAVANRSLQLTLRYEMRAGTLPVPLGGSRTSGVGSVSGTVFFDADANGRREANEAGAPNVTVLLDGRFVTRTDAAGRYEFPWVAAGEHTVLVIPDNVPLPWSPVRVEPVKTQVVVRTRTVEDFALQRDR